jgi:hypothetical protein
VGGSFLDASIDDELDPWEAEEVERLAVLEYQRRAYDERLMDRAQRRGRERESRKKGWVVKITFLSLLRFRSVSPSS